MLHPNRRSSQDRPIAPFWSLAVVLAILFPAAAVAQGFERSYAYGNVSQVRGDVWLQRAEDFGANEAESNSPFLPGDRLWTREPGQAELRFAGPVTAWLDERTKLDYVEGDQPHRLGFWTGSLLLRVEAEATVTVESPGGSLATQSAGRYRLDVLPDGQGVRFAAIEGVATVQSDAGSVVIASGQQTTSVAGGAPSAPEGMGRLDRDALSEWAASREQSRYQHPDDAPYYEDLPHEVREHVHDLRGHGRWSRDSHLGWVWYPEVVAGWAPYQLGRWAYTPFGYTWISHDPWGWAPYRYGRWGYGARGWYWLPGSVWGPAWVSWAWGPDWIGWSPLGYYNRPVYAFHYGRHGIYGGSGVRPGEVVGRAVARDSVDRRARPRRGWSFTERTAMGRPASRNRLDLSKARNLDTARVLSSGAVLDRDLRERAVGRTAISRATASTARSLSNVRRGAMIREERSTTGAQRLATPAAGARSRSSAGRATRPSGATPRTNSREARPRATTRGTERNSGRIGNRNSGRESAATRSSRPPRPRGATPRSGSRRPSSVRPRSGSDAPERAGQRAAPRSGSTPRSTPRSTSPRSRPSRPSSSAASRSRPSRPSSSAASRSRPSRPSSSAAPRSRPSRPSSSAAPRSRPSRPSSSAAPRSRPSKPNSSRSSSTSRRRPRSG